MVGELMEAILYVDDMAAAVAFYRDRLGLTLLDPICDDYGEEYWVIFDTGGCKLCLHGGGQRKQGPDAAKVVFCVADVVSARRELIGRGVQLSEARSPAPGIMVCDGTDPAGNPFSIESAAH